MLAETCAEWKGKTSAEERNQWLSMAVPGVDFGTVVVRGVAWVCATAFAG